MATRDVIVNLSKDAAARPIAVLVQIASKYESRIHILMKDKKINAKSIMGMMSLGFANGDSMTLEADGTDCEAAVVEMADYIESGK